MNKGITSLTEIEGEAKHTPTPWRQTQGDGIGNDSHEVGEINLAEDAQFICQAVNCHDELVDVLEDILGVDNPDSLVTSTWTANDWRNAKRQYNEAIREVLEKSKAKGGV